MNGRSLRQWRWPQFLSRSGTQMAPAPTKSNFWSGFFRRHGEDLPDDGLSQNPGDGGLKILVPFDFSGRSCAALDCAVRMARDRKATVTLLHAIYLNLSPYGPANPAMIRQEMRRTARAGISQLAAALSQKKNLSVNYAIRDGKPSAVVEQYLQDCSVDLVIIGDRRSRRPGWFRPRALAEGLVRRAPCPVLVIPTND